MDGALHLPAASRSESVPVIDDFARVGDASAYAPLPDDWVVGLCDVVDSSGAIAAGRYRAVNLAGAGAISAVANALGGTLEMFVFGGDGAVFAVAPEDAPAAADALRRTARWARRDLGLEMRVGMVPVAGIRAAGRDARVAFWRASDHVRYAMFAGGGLEWADAQLKDGAITLDPAPADAEPDLTGLSCRWGPVRSQRGGIVSLIVKPAPGAPADRVADVAGRVVRELRRAARLNPVPPAGPELHWPSAAKLALHERISGKGGPRWLRRLGHLGTLTLVWLIFRLGIRIGSFDPGRYRREMAANTDFRKFNDGLMMTLDCDRRTVARLRALLDKAARQGLVRYGLHEQSEALVTCFVHSALTPDHMHFIDGADGGYAAAARQLRQ